MGDGGVGRRACQKVSCLFGLLGREESGCLHMQECSPPSPLRRGSHFVFTVRFVFLAAISANSFLHILHLRAYKRRVMTPGSLRSGDYGYDARSESTTSPSTQPSGEKEINLEPFQPSR